MGRHYFLLSEDTWQKRYVLHIFRNTRHRSGAVMSVARHCDSTTAPTEPALPFFTQCPTSQIWRPTQDLLPRGGPATDGLPKSSNRPNYLGGLTGLSHSISIKALCLTAKSVSKETYHPRYRKRITVPSRPPTADSVSDKVTTSGPCLYRICQVEAKR